VLTLPASDDMAYYQKLRIAAVAKSRNLRDREQEPTDTAGWPSDYVQPVMHDLDPHVVRMQHAISSVSVGRVHMRSICGRCATIILARSADGQRWPSGCGALKWAGVGWIYDAIGLGHFLIVEFYTFKVGSCLHAADLVLTWDPWNRVFGACAQGRSVIGGSSVLCADSLEHSEGCSPHSTSRLHTRNEYSDLECCSSKEVLLYNAPLNAK
jgi:hypothetical protein